METSNYVAISPDMFVTWHKRLLNLIIDAATIYLIFVVLGVFAVLFSLLGFDGLSIWLTEMDGFTDRVITTLVMVLYLFTMEVLTQRTFGKYITGTMVVMEDGSKPEPRSIIIRALCRILTIEALSFIGSYPRGWHDSASGTYVVDAKKYKAALELKNSFDEIGANQINDAAVAEQI
ncbi:RDD family protein [Flavobacterium suzhouense]|uniref:RDD family protein n=1 Tax=Flavobacterium suzhouense TaxID=1529638 RepID=A0ABW5NVP4_9FLAO